MKNNNVSEYFKNLRNILDKLNNKYEFDTNKAQEFTPSTNELIILKTFLNGIHPSLSIIMYSRGISTLMEAYYVLEETENMTIDLQNIHILVNNINNKDTIIKTRVPW